METRVTILPNWLGDLVMASPAVERFATGHRHVAVGTPAALDLLTDVGRATETIAYDRRGADSGPGGFWRTARRIAAVGADRALVLAPSLRGAALAALAGVPSRAGYGGEGRELLLTHAPRVRGGARSQHLTRSWFELAGGTGAPPCPRWRSGPKGHAGLDQATARWPALAAHGRYAVYAAGATFGPAKQWPLRSFADLAVEVRDRWGLVPVFVGGPSEATVTGPLADRTDGSDLGGATDLPTLAAVLEGAGLFVGNDSGPMHLAAAMGAPTVGIFGSTSPTWTAPRGTRTAVAGPAPVTCAPCFRRDCPFALECLVELGVPTVLDTVAEVLEQDRFEGARER